ncbi:hypothetical protein D9613_001970 [Agrocybe pediades]|uniref:Peptidase S26 domain-containing protein n=1 Tax=Agrocybe pediades TaxID=84607 RepID=A0A8H4R648_9AGAR|nr:hypothetical protein D9613_001970 [Agrocybe pediades]
MTGPSMLPTFAIEGEIVIEDVITYRLFPDSIKRGDLVVAKSPVEPDTTIVCKRVIGLPGDIVCVDPTGEYAPTSEYIKVPEGHIWISGDNASFSRDSRTYGPVPKGLIIGRVLARVWPLRSFTIFRNPTTTIE